MEIFVKNKFLLRKIGVLSGATSLESKRMDRYLRTIVIILLILMDLIPLIAYCIFIAHSNFEKMKESLYIVSGYSVSIAMYISLLKQESNLRQILDDLQLLVNSRK